MRIDITVNIPIIFEDDWLCIVNKPPGLLTIPTPRHEARTLTSILNEDRHKQARPPRFYPCHRLDREASGVIVYAKGKSVQRKMMDAFKQRKVHKRYIAFVHGRPERGRGVIRFPIEQRPALTRYHVLKPYGDFSVVSVETETGRKNQIRIHFRRIGHPLVGESTFAYRKDYRLKAKRVCLHAQDIRFPHPQRPETVYAEADMSKDMKDFLKRHTKIKNNYENHA